jgi:hypothetical protein
LRRVKEKVNLWRDLLIAGKKDASESEREVNLIADLAEVLAETIKDLDMRDYLKIQDVSRSSLIRIKPPVG